MKKSIYSKIFIIAVIFALVSSLNILAQVGSQPTLHKITNKVTTDRITDNSMTVLYDQTAGVTTNAYTSQDFEASFDTYDNQIADNFTATATWTINQIVVAGDYSAAGPAAGFNIYFYTNSGGIPGTLVYSALSQPYIYDGVSIFTINLSTAAVLTAGDYWVSVQCRMDYGTGGQWFWNTVSGTYGTQAQWQNPGGGFAVGCLTWSPITGCLTAANTDMYFSLNNVAPGPGLATNPSPADGATGVSVPNVTLSWTNPAGATTNSVYFGTNPISLTQIHTGSLISSIGRTGLSYSTQYYWRVDETDGVGTTTGLTWSFTTMQDPAFIFYEPFNTLSCWTPIGPLGLTNWSVQNYNNAGGDSPPELYMNYFPSFVGLSKLVSCNITTAAIGQLHNLELDHYIDWYADPATFHGIGISYDNGATYTTIWETQPVGGSVGPENIQALFTPTASPFQFVLYCNGNSFNINWWSVDDITVTLPLANDVGTSSIDVASSIGSGSFSPQATVKNFGTNTQTFNVQMTIGAYSSTKTITGLAAGATQQVTFDNWNATPGSYTVNVCTQLAGDQNTANNCLSKPVTVFSGSWAYGNSSPVSARAYGGSATYGGEIFIMGGVDSTLTTRAECDKYNVNTNTWSSIAPLPSARDRLTAVTVGGFVYAIGGYDATNAYTATVFKYDIAGNSWTTVAPLPAATGWGQAVAYGNKIYIVGGVITGDVVTSAVYVYDVTSNTWATATSLPDARFGGACAITGNQIVYVAGVTGAFALSDVVYVGSISGGDPTLIAWTTAANKFPSSQEFSHSVFSDNLNSSLLIKPNKDKKIPEALPYPVGGMYRFDGATWGTDGIIVATGSGAGSPSSCYVYKPGSDTWLQQADVLLPLLGANVGSVNDGNTWKFLLAWGDPDGSLTNNTRTVQIFTDNLGGASTFQLSVNVANGWNMVSIPGLHPTDQNVSTWWAFRDLGANVFRYAGGYQSVTAAVPGTGYWMKHTGARLYNTGDEWPAGGIQTVPHAPLTAASGWNLFGGYELVVTAANVTTNPPGLQSGPIYKYSGGYAVATTLDPGYGYWIKLNAAGQIIIPETMAKGEVVEYFPDDWGKIVLTDATGINYTLYAVKGEFNLDDYELPPAPPTGMFDIRFSSGRIAEDINSSVKTIDMSGVTYPLTVRVENMDIRLMDETGKSINVNLKAGEDVVIADASVLKLMVSGELIPSVYALEQNYPNPFNPSTVIEFSLPEDVSNVKLSIYSALGEKVAELVNTSLTAGKYQYQWNAQNVATGMYIYELRTDNFVSVKKMLLLK